MNNDIHNLPNGSGKNTGKNTKKDPKVLIAIRQRVEKGLGKTIAELKNEYSEETIFCMALKHVYTTKKALCEALDLTIEAHCRTKRKAEKAGKLVQSYYKIICPYTKHKAHALTTDEPTFPMFTQSIQYLIPFNRPNQ
jgi:hypothetical protein